VVGWTRLGVAHIQQGDIERGLECCNEALALAPLARDGAWARVVRGYGKIKAGGLEDGIAELREGLAWFESSHMRWTHVIGAVWLAEGYLRRDDRAHARPMIDHVLATSQATGYLHHEGRAHWLMSECLANDTPADAEKHVEAAIRIFERVDARNDLAKAMVTRAALRQRAGDLAAAQQLLDAAKTIFHTLGTHGDFARVDAALVALAGGAHVPFLADAARRENPR